MTQPELIATAKRIAATFGLDPALVCAVIEQESAWDTNAIRLEQAFFRRYVLPLKLGPLESLCRSASWGLCQVMGQVARENGYDGDLEALCTDPAMGIQVGCMVLKKKMARAGGDLRKGLLLWNGGSNKAYPDEVIARIDKYR